MTEGILYIADGREYVREAIDSAKSVRRQMPDVNISLATREPVESGPFDDIRPLEHDYEGVGQSILTPELMVYDRTIFLDTDTYVAEPVDELFDLLNDFELCFSWGAASRKLPEPYAEWPEFNTGVIGFRKSKTVENIFRRWRADFDERVVRMRANDEIISDQPSFGKAVLDSSARFYLLPRTYNCRLPRVGYVGEDVKIGHGRLDGYAIDLEEAVNRIHEHGYTCIYGKALNSTLGKTIVAYGNADFLSESPLKSFMSLLRTFIDSTREEGLGHSIALCGLRRLLDW